MTRPIRVLALSLAFAFTAAALAQTALSFWSWRTEDVAAYETFIAEFEAENPDVRVTFTPYLNTEYNTIVSTALQGGGGPDIVHLRAYGGMEPLANAGLIVRLDDKVPALADFDPGILLGATNRADGGVYGVPFALQTVQVLYNEAMFERLGLSEPTTWAELLALGDALKAAGVYALANGTKDPWTIETLSGAVAPTFYGCTPFFQEITAGETDFTDPRYVGALERMVALRPYLADNYMGVGYTDMQTLFRLRAGRHADRRVVRARQHGQPQPRPPHRLLRGPRRRRLEPQLHQLLRRRLLRHQRQQREPGRGAALHPVPGQPGVRPDVHGRAAADLGRPRGPSPPAPRWPAWSR
jgi:ABC-type glycerol-3-phosphate transport system substrate-binding protein